MGLAMACDCLGVAGWTCRGLEAHVVQCEMLPGVRESCDGYCCPGCWAELSALPGCCLSSHAAGA